MRASQGLTGVVKVDEGLYQAWADLAADQGRTLAPLGTDDGSVAAAYRIYKQAQAAAWRLRKVVEHSDEISRLQEVKEENVALYKARLNDPANAKEREVFEVYRKQKNQRNAQYYKTRTR